MLENQLNQCFMEIFSLFIVRCSGNPGYNILLMDEPSNFLDIPSLEALEILMKEYAGTIVFITHDKRLLDNVADVVYEISDKKINLKH